jgi:tocopherol cyclase
LKIWSPEIFQGSLKNKHYFEGWYYKSVDAGENNAFAVIPGISLAGDKSHSFIQFLDGPNHKAYYFKHGVNDFWAAPDKFEIKIGKSYFSRFKMQLDIDEPQATIKARLDFKNIAPWPVSLFSPGVMGWYRFVPKMECYHGVLSFNHAISGYFDINGVRKDFTGGKGYSEKDWGTSMPSSWIWFQTNHFEENEVSIFASIAKIPWLGSFFTGYIFGLYLRGKIYRFTTYTGAKVSKLIVDKEQIVVIVEDRNYSLEMTAKREAGADLPAPLFGEMSSKVNESLKSKIFIRFTDKKSGAIIFSGTGRNAGLEFVGDINELLKGFN